MVSNCRETGGNETLQVSKHADLTYLVDTVLLTQLIIGHIQCVEDTYHLHGVQAGAHGGEADNVTEQDGHRRELAACVKGSFPTA